MDWERYHERKETLSQLVAALQKATVLPKDGIVGDAVLRRFLLVYQVAWNSAQFLVHRRNADARGPTGIWSDAQSMGLIDDSGVWLRLHRARSRIARAYNPKVAKKVHAVIAADAQRAFHGFLSGLQAFETAARK